MSNTISRTFLGQNVTVTVVNVMTKEIDTTTCYIDGKLDDINKIRKTVQNALGNELLVVSVDDVSECNQTREMTVDDFIKYSYPIDTRDVKGYRERPSKKNK